MSRLLLRLASLTPRRCHALHMIKVYKGNYIICLTDAVLEQHQRTKAKKRKTIDPSKLVWKP